MMMISFVLSWRALNSGPVFFPRHQASACVDAIS